MTFMSRRPGDPSVAVASLRVSTDEQKLGPEAQRAAIGAWATREGVRVAAWFSDEGVSGGADLVERPGLVAAIAALRELRAGVLVVAKRDRLARDVYVALTLERVVAAAGARVACADGVANGDTPADAFLRTILDGAAAYERALIRARTKAALQAKKSRGERVGMVPFGYMLAPDGKILLESPIEQQVLGLVAGLRRGGLSIRRIVCECARAGVTGRSGRPLSKTQIERLLRRSSSATRVA
jgi:DNA invertase Pin-like site-specific DNA recombinase